MKSIILHDMNFTEEEFAVIGRSGLHEKTEKFYIQYGIQKAIYFYSNIRVQNETENPKYFREIEAYKDAVNILVKLCNLRQIIACPQCGEEQHNGIEMECNKCIDNYIE